MITITLTVSKAKVYDEVAKTTSYTGNAMDDEKAYDRIFADDNDREMLERFWVEACNGATEQFKPFLTSVTSQPISHGVELGVNYEVTLELSSMFDPTLQNSIETSLHSYFVAMIVAKWFKFVNKAEAESYGTDAMGMMEDVMRKIYYRKKPTRIAVS